MAQSYTLAILRDGYPPQSERRSFADLPQSALRTCSARYPDGSIPDNDALLIVNLWNKRSVQQAEATGQPVRFMYFL